MTSLSSSYFRRIDIHWLISGLALLALTSCYPSGPTPAGTVPVPQFEEIALDFHPAWADDSHPFVGAAAIDIESDGRMEFFIGGGENQDDGLFAYRDGALINIIANSGLSGRAATHGATSIDMDADGDVDLLVARSDGVYLYSNDGGVFSRHQIPVNLPSDSVPFNIAVADIDRDGDGDLYISVFINYPAFRSATYNDPSHNKTNLLLRNNGNLSFEDITETAGVASLNNTFLSVFTDLNQDGWPDLVVAQNTGEVEIFRNMKNASFTRVPLVTGYGFWMGLALGDIDRDGDQDLFFSNVGTSIPSFLTRGDLRDEMQDDLGWLLLRNDGDFRFADITTSHGLDHQGFGWGTVFEDLNLDGELDLLVAQNYIKWPFHDLWKLPAFTALSRTTTTGSRAFFHTGSLGLENPTFGQAPLILDLNSDGYQDLVWINMDNPARAFLGRGEGRYIRVAIPDTVAALGTRVTVQTDQGNSYTREATNNLGMSTDQSTDMVFGLGDASVQKIIIRSTTGKEHVIENPPINQRIDVSR